MALIAACALASPAGAATKPYSVVISPTTVVAGGTVTFDATITNRTANQSLGSANLTPPAGVSITGVTANGGTASLSGNVVQLRNLALASGQSVVATITATVASSPCGGAPAEWKVPAKQSNDFNGTGNDFGPLVDSSITTSTTCDAGTFLCSLASCTGSATQPGLATLTVSSPGSVGRLTISTGSGLNCAGYEEILPKDFVVDFVPDPGTVGQEKTVTIEITKAAMQASTNNGLSQVNVCFGAPFAFPVKSGTPALQDGPGGFKVGLLPDCGAPPCVKSRQAVGGGARIVVRAPGGSEDPRYGP